MTPSGWLQCRHRSWPLYLMDSWVKLILHTPNLFAAVKYVGIKSVRAPHSVPLMAILIFLDSWFNNVSSPAVYIVVYTDAAVLYSDRIVLNGPDLNEISCYLQKQPGEQEEAALARWGGEGGGGQTIDYISYSISNRKQTRHNTDTQSDLRTPFKAISGWHWNILNIIKLWEPTHHFHQSVKRDH